MTTSSIPPKSTLTNVHQCDENKSLSSRISKEPQSNLREQSIQRDKRRSTCNRGAKHWKMIIIILIPVLSLTSLATYSLLKAAKVKKASVDSIQKVKVAHLYANLIQMLQRERGISSTYLSTSSNRNVLLDIMLKARTNSDQAFAQIPSNHDAIYIQGIPHTIFEVQKRILLSRAKIENGSFSVEDHLTFYTQINTGLMNIMFNDVSIPGEYSCILDVVAFSSLVRWTDVIGLLRARIAFQYATCEFTSETLQNYKFLTGEAKSYKDIFTHYSSDTKTAFLKKNQSAERYLEDVRNTAWSESFLKTCKTKSKEDRLSFGLMYFENMTELIDFAFDTQQLLSKVLIGKLLDINKNAEFQFHVYLTVQFIVIIVSIILTIWYILCIGDMTLEITNNAVELECKSKELAAEREVTESLKYQWIPKNLRNTGTVNAESFENVTVFMSDIVNFTELETRSSAKQIINLLNDLYGLFDREAKKYDVQKIETLGDSYMVASGVPERNGNAHALHICNLALVLQEIMKRYQVPRTFERLEIVKVRIGIHSGPCAAGLLGLKMPRYCLFGETVSMAKRLKSAGRGGKIHVSSKTFQLIKGFCHFKAFERGNIKAKGRRPVKTYWLESSAQ
ncbi:uncharacterized protein LOC134230582 [Saccostrea cucullata]|uniref:uncharacterized protein LOC134230582 n=1 Tax=Saccostrea cuccullata TaxID=36930 RepID=UPI002ED03BBD